MWTQVSFTVDLLHNWPKNKLVELSKQGYKTEILYSNNSLTIQHRSLPRTQLYNTCI